MRADLKDIKCQLVEICNKEALRLWRQARRMEAHGVSKEKVIKCREEADRLYNTGYPERVLDDYFSYKTEFAFKEV